MHAAAVAGADPMRTGLEAVRFGWTAFIIPFLFVASPSLLLIGGADSVALAVATAAIGVWLVSIALAGHFTRPLGLPMRVLFAAAGLLALIPAGAFAQAIWTDVAGLLAGCVLITREYLAARMRSVVQPGAE